MICVIFRSKLEIPEEGYNILDVVLNAKQFWYIVYALPIGDFNVLVRLVIQIIYISWNRNIKRKKIFNYTKLWFYVQIKHFIEDHCADQAQQAEGYNFFQEHSISVFGCKYNTIQTLLTLPKRAFQ